VLLWSTAAGLLLQSLAVRLALATGMHLARACREEYPRRTRLALWALTEAAIVASDVPEVIGTAFALKMLFKLPLPAGVLLTAADSLAFLGLTRLGVRALEAFLGALVAAVGVCWLVELCMADVDAGAAAEGALLPRIRSRCVRASDRCHRKDAHSRCGKGSRTRTVLTLRMQPCIAFCAQRRCVRGGVAAGRGGHAA
jgi:NRAMP (natural resistance-associated macrophage protein)-like metal ion transporter